MTTTNDIPDWANVIARPDTILQGSPLAYTNPQTIANFTVPTGVHILSIVVPDYLNVTWLQIFGLTTNTTYAKFFPETDSFQQQYYVLIPAGADTSVKILIEANVPGTMYITGVSDTVAVAVLPQNPAPWQAPNAMPMDIFFSNPGASQSHTILGAQGNQQQIYLHTLQGFWDVANTGVTGLIQQNNGNGIISIAAIIAGQPYYMDFKGAALGQNQGIVFLQTGAAAINTSNFRGAMTYSVY